MTKYDITIQWTDGAQQPGYQETIESAVVAAESLDAAFAAGFALRPQVSRVQIHGVAGTGIAYQGAAFVREGLS
jgi:hypothetical protein